MSEPEVSVIATFPPGFFLENIVTLPDDSLLVTVASRSELYCLPPSADESSPRSPILLQSFARDAFTFGMVLAPQKPSLVYLLTGDFLSQGSRTHHLRFLDFSNPAQGCRTSILAQFPSAAKALNGITALSDEVLLVADSFAGCIWRVNVELTEDGLPKDATITEWLRDPLLEGQLRLPDFQPGANGLKYSRVANAVCFTSTQQKLFAKIEVDRATLRPKGDIEVLHRGAQGDDLIIDDEFGSGPVAYLTTHRNNSIIRVPISGETGLERDCPVVVQGGKDHPKVLGPTSGAWKWGAEGKVAYFPCDGGLKHPLPGETPRHARVVRVVF